MPLEPRFLTVDTAGLDDGDRLYYDEPSRSIKGAAPGTSGSEVFPATTATVGTVKLSTAPVDPASPIAVGDNDPRLPAQSFVEAVQDLIASFFVAGSGIAYNYDDVTGTFTITNSAPLTSENVQDIVGAMVTAGSNLTSIYDDATGTLTINAAGSSTLTTEDVRDIVGAILVAGANVTITVNDAADTVTVAATGGGSGAVSSVNGATGAVVVDGTNISVTDPTDATATPLDDALENVLAASVPLSQKGAANGVATLDGSGYIPTAQIPVSLLGALRYQGTWNATTNSPAIPAASSTNKGYYYRVATAGTTTIDGTNDWGVGDWIVSNGTTWDKIDNSEIANDDTTTTAQDPTNSSIVGTLRSVITNLYNAITNRAPKGLATASGLTSTTGKLLGRSTTGTGALEEITLGTGLSFSGTTLNATGGAAGDFLSTLSNSEVSVTNTATLTISKMHVCSGTSANYTVTLPAASGNTGKLIGIRMASGLTKLVTVKGNASELIDGQNTRVMWSQESCILLCDGTGWSKISGKTRAMVAVMRLSSPGSAGAAQSIASGTMTKVLLNATDIDNTGLMASTSNNRVNIQRPGLYQCSGLLAMVCTSAVPRFISNLYKTGTQDISAEVAIYVGSGNVPNVQAQGERSLVAGDYMELDCYQSSGSSQNLYGDPSATTCLLRVVELPSW